MPFSLSLCIYYLSLNVARVTPTPRRKKVEGEGQGEGQTPYRGQPSSHLFICFRVSSNSGAHSPLFLCVFILGAVLSFFFSSVQEKTSGVPKRKIRLLVSWARYVFHTFFSRPFYCLACGGVFSEVCGNRTPRRLARSCPANWAVGVGARGERAAGTGICPYTRKRKRWQRVF